MVRFRKVVNTYSRTEEPKNRRTQEPEEAGGRYDYNDRDRKADRGLAADGFPGAERESGRPSGYQRAGAGMCQGA